MVNHFFKKLEVKCSLLYYILFYQFIILKEVVHNVAAFLLLEEIKIKPQVPLNKTNYLEIH